MPDLHKHDLSITVGFTYNEATAQYESPDERIHARRETPATMAENEFQAIDALERFVGDWRRRAEQRSRERTARLIAEVHRAADDAGSSA